MAFVRESSITVLRVTEGTIDKSTGRFGPDTEVEIPDIVGSLQPILGEDLVRAPEGARSSGLLTMYLHVEIDEKDIVVHKGKRYQVQQTAAWYPEYSPLPHFRYMCMEEGDQI